MNDNSSIELIKNGLRFTTLSLVQVCVFVILYDAIIDTYISYVGPMNRLFGFGQQFDNGTLLLCILAGLNSGAQILSERLWIRLALPAIGAVTWIFYWGNIEDDVPNRFLAISFLGMVSFLCGVLLAPNEKLAAVYLK